jgi:polyphosphate kinase 2 (PPK2 family)
MMIFNRSHYEDVLVPVVNGWITPDQTRQRMAHINDFERLLARPARWSEVHAAHQRRTNSACACRSAWTTSPSTGSSVWVTWRCASSGRSTRPYEALLGATSTPWAPWTVVPADSKTHRNLMIATLVRDKLKSLGLRYPPEDAKLRGLKID